jgi:ribose-phosphate pyrophosphokinase
VRVEAPVEGRYALIACTLDRPDDKLVPLLLLAAAVRETGARSVGLVAPYLAYMRQDRRFQPGEPISARHVAAWISRHVDWLVTVDPHLHRIADLSQVYSVPARVVHAADSVAAWVRAEVRKPVLIGPDEESAQWVGDVARRAGLAAPVCVAVHAVFAQTAFEELRAAGAGDIVSCDTIHHPSSRISLAAAIAAGVRELLP